MSADWHGWEFRDGTKLHIGPVPTRKSVCIYTVEDSVMHVIAYCRSEEEGRRLLRFLDRALASVGASP